MTSRPGYRTGRGLLRLAVAGAVAVGTPIALAGNAEAAPSSVWDKVAQCESGGAEARRGARDRWLHREARRLGQPDRRGEQRRGRLAEAGLDERAGERQRDQRGSGPAPGLVRPRGVSGVTFRTLRVCGLTPLP